MKKDYLGENFWIKNPEEPIVVKEIDFFIIDPIEEMITKIMARPAIVVMSLMGLVMFGLAVILGIQAYNEVGLKAIGVLTYVGRFIEGPFLVVVGLMLAFVFHRAVDFYHKHKIESQYEELGYLPC